MRSLSNAAFAHARKTDLIVYTIAPPPPPSLSGLLSCVAKKLGGKAIWLSLLVAVMFSLSYSPQVKAQPQNCAADPCEGTEWIPFNTAVSYSLFDYCHFTAYMRYKRCPDGKYYFELLRIGITRGTSNDPNYSTQCADLLAWLQADPAHYQQVFESAVEKLSSFWWLPINYATNLNYRCPNGSFMSESYLAGCTKYCRYDDTRSATVGGTEMTYIIPLDCGSGNCCKVTYHSCYDINLQQVVTTRTSTPTGPTGINCGLINATCPQYFTVQNSGTVGGTYDIQLSSSTACVPNSCQP